MTGNENVVRVHDNTVTYMDSVANVVRMRTLEQKVRGSGPDVGII